MSVNFRSTNRELDFHRKSLVNLKLGVHYFRAPTVLRASATALMERVRASPQKTPADADGALCVERAPL